MAKQTIKPNEYRNEENKKSEGHSNSWSNMKFSPFSKMDKMMEMQHHHMESMKEAKDIMSAMMKEISELNSRYIEKNVKEIQKHTHDMIERMQHSDYLNQRIFEFKDKYLTSMNHFNPLKIVSFENLKNSMDHLKHHNSKLSRSFKDAHQQQMNQLQKKMEEHQDYQKGLSEKMQASAYKMMDVMKKVANGYSSSHQN